MSSYITRSNAPSLVKTLNNMGYTSRQLNQFVYAFLDSLEPREKLNRLSALEIGAAMGFSVEEALKRDALVTANDLDPKHLEVLKNRLSPDLLPALKTCPGRFPEDLTFNSCSFDFVLAMQVLHFLEGTEIEAGLLKIYDWLKPGGKFFVTMGTPYTRIIESFIPVFEKRKAEGDPWPGTFEIKEHCNDPECVKDNPSRINFVDQDILERILKKAGFQIECIEEFSRNDIPEELKLEGRECVGAIAVKKV